MAKRQVNTGIVDKVNRSENLIYLLATYSDKLIFLSRITPNSAILANILQLSFYTAIPTRNVCFMLFLNHNA